MAKRRYLVNAGVAAMTDDPHAALRLVHSAAAAPPDVEKVLF